MIQGFGQEITEIPAFGHDITEVRAMGELAWQKQSSIPDYLCFTALEAGQFTLTIPAAVTATYLSYVEWSKDGRTWNHTDNTSEAVTIDVQVASGEKVYWRGSGKRYAINDSASNNYYQNASYFSADCDYDASGNIMSLLYAADFADKTSFPGTSSEYYNLVGLFQHNEHLIHAANLSLPATTLKPVVYSGMFQYCSNMIDAPSLPAATLASYCYRYMFRNCTSLMSSVDLTHVTTVAGSCCQGMYDTCTALTSASIPSAAVLASSCYREMYDGCSQINHVKCLATDISAKQCLLYWLRYVSSTGTFIQAAGVTWPRGASGIPTGWVDVEKRTMPSGYKQVEYVANPNYGYINISRALNLNSEKVEIAFVKMASGNSCPLGNPTYNYRYGSLKVINISSALTIRVGVDYDDQVYKQVSISPVTADNPHTFQYVGNSSGFQLYFDGALKSTETCAWDAVSPYQSNLLFSANTNAASSPASFHTNPIYYLKIWDSNNAPAVDYVAAIRESDGVAGFYDMANNVFHKSDNANDFTAGEEI